MNPKIHYILPGKSGGYIFHDLPHWWGEDKRLSTANVSEVTCKLCKKYIHSWYPQLRKEINWDN